MFTSESVSEGHPDKICDRISDAIVDTFLDSGAASALRRRDAGHDQSRGAGRRSARPELRSPTRLLIEVARNAIREIGYEQEDFHWQRAAVECHIHGQSADIAQGVDAAGNKDEGAGDQGMMFGYACTETPELMPAPIYYAHAILRSLSEARHAGKTPLLGPDAKSQVTLRYVDGKPVRATKVVVSIQHSDRIEQDEVREIVRPHVLRTSARRLDVRRGAFSRQSDRPLCDRRSRRRRRRDRPQDHRRYLWRRGAAWRRRVFRQGPDQGRSLGAYAARYLAKNVVAAGLAERCTIQVAYAIGVAKPLSFYVDTDWPAVDEAKLAACCRS